MVHEFTDEDRYLIEQHEAPRIVTVDTELERINLFPCPRCEADRCAGSFVNATRLAAHVIIATKNCICRRNVSRET